MSRLDRDEFRQDMRDANYVARRGGLSAAGWIVIGIVFIIAISAGIWVFNVATSDVKGKGDATRQINSGKNRIAAQENFEALFGQIKAYDRNLDQAAQDKKEHPGDSFYATNYSGLVKQCNDAVAQYNADANKVSRAKWLTDDLPFQIDDNDTTTDCKESTK